MVSGEPAVNVLGVRYENKNVGIDQIPLFGRLSAGDGYETNELVVVVC
jgi:hypothetical protein